MINVNCEIAITNIAILCDYKKLSHILTIKVAATLILLHLGGCYSNTSTYQNVLNVSQLVLASTLSSILSGRLAKRSRPVHVSMSFTLTA